MPTTTPKTLLVAGVMSGTSADGIDVALCRIAPGSPSPTLELLRHGHYPYPPAVREAVLLAMTDRPTTAAQLARLNWRLGELYADAVEQTCGEDRPDLIGLHGQTLYHQSTPEPFLGAPTRATWQTGEPAVLAERLRVPVVSDFRPADLAAGGQGAPLVPMLDFHYFRDAKQSRVLLNLGGIANLTVLPAGCTLDDVLAFDTGPANMVIDECMRRLFSRNFDPGGSTATAGMILPGALAALMAHPYFIAAPPKSCGREEFGAPFAAEAIRLCRLESQRDEDVVATVTELTAQSIFAAFDRFSKPHLRGTGTALIASGGGTENAFLLERLRVVFAPAGILLFTTDDCDLPSMSKEAAAFALLAWLTWQGLPGNVPSATGARRPTILGRITCV